MSHPLVSILVPCHNAAPYLRATLDSALAQTHLETEIIVVDDGSSDDSLAIARSYAPRVRVMAGPQRGASEARNTATRESRGDFLQYLDADDLLLPDAIATRVRRLGETGGDVACGDWRRLLHQADGSWAPGADETADYRRFADAPDLAVFNGFWAPPAALLYRRAIVERIGGWNPALPVIQDARFLFDAAFFGARFVHVPGVSAQYRQHSSDSLSSRSTTRFWADVLKNNRDIEKLLLDAGRMDRARRDAMGRAYALGARVTFRIDRDLYYANLGDLRRFPEQSWSPYLRAAAGLERLIGYSAAVTTMGILRPGQKA
jgi:glycosyltransferase involved in cell wall biosynthesis